MPFGISLFQGNVAINNFGQVAGVLSNNTAFFDGSPSPGLPTFHTYSTLSGCLALGGVNDSGVFSVNGREKTSTKPNSTWGSLGTFRVSSQQERILEGGYPVGINFSSDVAINASGPNYIAYNGSSSVTKQVLKVTDLIADSDPLKAMLVNNTLTIQALNDRDSTTGFGQLSGRLFIANGMLAVVLTPYIP